MSQDFYCGVKSGVRLSPYNFNYSLGITSEFTPHNSVYSAGVEIHYLFVDNIFFIPITGSFAPGNRVTPRLSGGILPLIRIKPIEPEDPLGIGGIIKLGMDVKLGIRTTLFYNISLYIIPNKYYAYSHFSPPTVVKGTEAIPSLNFGVKYMINKVSPVHNTV